MFSNNNVAYELSIQMSSIQLSREVAKKNETIRVSITTLPERQKQAFHVKAKEFNCFNHTFKVNITKNTEKIIVVFRKKDFFGLEQIIASTIIRSNQFPIFGNETGNEQMPIISEVNNVNIYEPIQHQTEQKKKQNNNYFYEYVRDYNNNETRKVIGNIRVQFMINKITTNLTNYYNKQNQYDYHYNENMNQRQEQYYRNTTLEIY